MRFVPERWRGAEVNPRERARPPAETADPYERQIDRVVSEHVPPNGLSFEDAWVLAARALAHGLATADGNGSTGRAGQIVDRLAGMIVRDGREALRHAAVRSGLPPTGTMSFIVAGECLSAKGSSERFDRDEIRKLVEAVFGLAMELRRRDPGLARWILEYEAAVRARYEADVEPGDREVTRGRLPAPTSTAERPDPDNPDVGLALIGALHKRLMIDEPWTIRHQRGFTWLGHRLLQTVSASPLVESRGLTVSLIEACTTLVENVQAPPAKVDEVLAELNLLAIGSAYLFWPEDRRIVSVLSQVVHQETLADRADQLSAYQILQLCEAERVAGTLAEMFDGQVAFRAHPETGARVEPDDMLNMVRDYFQPQGAEPSRFAVAAEFERVVDLVRDSPFASLGASAEGVCVEVPFGESSTTLIELSAVQPHPILGSGLAVRTTLPWTHEPPQAAATAAQLGHGQLGTVEGGAYLGAWCVRHEGERAYTAWMRFVPNALFRPGYAVDVAMGEINRAIWVDRLYFPELPQRDAWRVLCERYGANASGGGEAT